MKRILRFTAAWCKPCTALKQNLERAELLTPIEVYDIDENTEIANEYGIRNLPTMILMDENTEVSRMVGVKTPKQLKEWAGE